MFYYQFHIGDYVKATRHLTNLEDLAYRRLMDLYYDTEEPLIADVKKLARLINMRENEDEIKNVLDDFFDLDGDVYRQDRIDFELESYAVKVETARLNGKKGGRPRKPKGKANDNPKKTQLVSNGNQEESESKAIPITHDPINPPSNDKYCGEKSPDKFNDEDLRFSEWFYQSLLAGNPEMKKPSLKSKSWADSIRLMRERDNRTYDQMADLLTWTISHNFWSSIVQSPKKLREKWDQLTKQRSNSSQPQRQGAIRQDVNNIDHSIPEGYKF